jgi:hypothetical protein
LKRSELYEKVWATPIYRLAKELGVSDVGLAKACKRHVVPVPPRGYWAKLNAGQTPERLSLPQPEIDEEVYLAIPTQDELAQRERVRDMYSKAAIEAGEQRLASDVAEFDESIDKAHPLVVATKKFADTLPALLAKEDKARRAGTLYRLTDRAPSAEHGRYSLRSAKALDITASLEQLDWIFRFHATILKGLVDGGMKVRRHKAEDGQRERDQKAVEMAFKGEILTFSFSEGYSRTRLSPLELKERQKEDKWVREYVTQPSGKFTFCITGSEYKASKTWQGSREKLQSQVTEIVSVAFQLAALQPKLRAEREAQEAEARRAAALQRLDSERRAARKEQLKKAFQLVEADTRVTQLEMLLERLEANISSYRAPFDERLRVWIGVVRAELESANPVDEILTSCLTVPSWSKWPPAWWPADAVDLDDSQG